MKLKRWLAMILSVCVILSCIPVNVNAETIASGISRENFKWKLDSEGTLTISGEGPMENFYAAGSVTQGSWVYGNIYPEWGYEYIEKIKKVVLSRGITTVGNAAFYGCANLDSVEIPDTVTSIGRLAFMDCGKVESISIPENVTSIGDNAFLFCDGLTSIIIPDKVSYIGESAFRSCKNLKIITFSGNAPEIGEDAFEEVAATAYYPQGNPTWTLDVMKNHGGILSWVPMENTEDDSSVMTEGSVEGVREYIPAVLDAIEDAQSYGWGDGYGGLFDIDGNGIEELIMVHSVDMETDDGYGVPAKVCSVYSMSNGDVIQLIDKELLFTEAGGPSGYAAVVEYDGKVYFAITSENGETVGNPEFWFYRVGDWKLYTIKGTTITLDTDVKYEYYEGNQIDYNRSFATINGNKCNYREYEEWEKRIEIILQVDPYEDRGNMTLEKLLEYLQNNSIEESNKKTAELKVYTTFPYATIGVDQTAKLLITLLVNGEPAPIQEFALGNNNSEVIDLVDTKDADGVRVLTFKTLGPGVANLTFTEGTTGATVSIELAVEEMCSYYRCSNFPIPDASSFPIHIADFQCAENSNGTHNVKFNAYNTSYAYGAAIVYDETGAFWSCVPLNPKYDGTGMEYIANGFWQSWEQAWYWIDGDKEFYEVAGNAMLTEVEFNNIPQNAKIVITADGRESVYPVLYTGIDIFLKVAFYSANIDVNINVYQKSVKEFVGSLLKALPADAAQNTIQTLTTDISMALIDGVNSESVEKIYQAVWNMFKNLGLDADEMLKNVLSGLGYSVADTVVIAAVPAYSFVDLVNKIVATSWLFVDYDSNFDRGKMEIHCVEHESNNQLVNSSVVVIQQSEFSKDTILDAYVVTDAEELGTLPDSVASNIENYSVYNITLRESGAEVQPGEEIEIRVPIPENVNPDKCVIYRVEDDGTLTLLPATAEKGYIVFTTTHLSYYIVGESVDEKAGDIPNNSKSNGGWLWIAGGIGAALAFGILGVLKKKRSEKARKSVCTDSNMLSSFEQKTPRASKSKYPIKTIIIVVLLLAVGIGIVAVLRNSTNTDKEMVAEIIDEVNVLCEAKNYDEAIAKIEDALDEYPDSDDLKDKLSEIVELHTDSEIAAIIADADELAAENDYEAAVQVLKAGLSLHPDSATLQTKVSEYTNALAEKVKTQILVDAKVLADAGNYEAAMSAIKAAQEKYGTNKEYEEAYAAYESAYSRQIEATVSTTEAYMGIIDVGAGGWCSLALNADGTVLATGRNQHGQCNVSSWHDIIAISGGDSHTVGLKADGTVVVAGINNYGQSNITHWENVAGISAGTFHTAGVKKDGTAVAVGRNDEGQCNVEGWTEIVQIAAGEYHTVGLRADGTVVAVGRNNKGQCDVSGWTDIIDIAAGVEHTVGLKADGTVIAIGLNKHGQCKVGKWEGITDIVSGDYHTVGLKSDGTVVATGFNDHGQCKVSSWKNIVKIAARYGHTVGLTADGKVVAVGWKDYGICDVTSW